MGSNPIGLTNISNTLEENFWVPALVPSLLGYRFGYQMTARREQRQAATPCRTGGATRFRRGGYDGAGEWRQQEGSGMHFPIGQIWG